MLKHGSTGNIPSLSSSLTSISNCHKIGGACVTKNKSKKEHMSIYSKVCIQRENCPAEIKKQLSRKAATTTIKSSNVSISKTSGGS